MPALAGAVAACWIAALIGCKQPHVGSTAQPAESASDATVELTNAEVDGTGRVVVSLRLTSGGVPVATAEAAAELGPRFTLAALQPHPADLHAAWRSLLLTGEQIIPQLPPGGPGTPPAAILTDARQPGVDEGGILLGADGVFTYAFAEPLPADVLATDTLRAGVWLAEVGTAEATATLDLRRDGGPPSPREVVLAANCRPCHGVVHSPHGATGVKICQTCHTWQNADPDTVDPAAMLGQTAATDPNPLELGRMVHRIHRGKNLPTLYESRGTDPAPDLATATALPLPFFPGQNTAVPGQKYAIVGALSREVVYGRITSRVDNGLPARVVAEGVVYPRDLRECGACHRGAPEEHVVLTGISRRTCQGCHPEAWFQDAAGIVDGGRPDGKKVHFAHPGGPQADDDQCAGCHVAATAAQPKVWAPIAEIHVPPRLSRRENTPTAEIVEVRDLAPGLAPTVVFKIADEAGPLVPSLSAPVPANDTRAYGTPLPRAFAGTYPYGRYFAIMINGPTAPDYLGLPSAQVASTAPGNPDVYALTADPATGEYTYTFTSTLPADAAGTWTVALEGYRRSYARSQLYDGTAHELRWPYTGEALFEAFANPMVDVDTVTGVWRAESQGTTARRRTVVTQERCLRCHGHLPLHGGMRNQVAHCIGCHTATATDWSQRPKVNGDVNLSATLDGIEERSIHFKVLIHRIHTGGREGIATLEGIEPHVVYGYGGNPYVFDEGIFPNDLANCTLCHEGKSYLVESVPADAPPTVANETPTIRHAGSGAHAAGEPATPPIQAACLGCHAGGATLDHAARNTLGGVERCADCHVRGALSVDVAHGLAAPGAASVSATYASIAEKILVPRCASAACHGGSPPAYFPQLDADVAYDEMVEKFSQQASGVMLVKPFAPEESYLLVKSRGDGASLGGVGTPMPINDAALTPSELAAIEAWIANGAQR